MQNDIRGIDCRAIIITSSAVTMKMRRSLESRFYFTARCIYRMAKMICRGIYTWGHDSAVWARARQRDSALFTTDSTSILCIDTQLSSATVRSLSQNNNEGSIHQKKIKLMVESLHFILSRIDFKETIEKDSRCSCEIVKYYRFSLAKSFKIGRSHFWSSRDADRRW